MGAGSDSGWSLAYGALAFATPVAFLLSTLVVSPARPFVNAKRAAFLSIGIAVFWAWLGAGHGPREGAPFAGALRARVDVATGVMALVVSTLASVILRYSERYLAGDPGQARYVRWLLATLAAVSIIVVSNDLLVITVAWGATSLALHQLLTFYGERPAALLAAHKKFLVSRLADVCLLSATALVYGCVGSTDLDVLLRALAAYETLPLTLHAAAVLLVLAVSLKSAQLPFHGWLTQVMEAPTPVSALLHAGIVNIGGFVMIRLSPLMALAEYAQWLLVLVGLTTALLAALVMTTRVSVKVALAWSTSAQMGFMLVQCGLGAWHLALLHLAAHSLYKAHAFLRSGSTVDEWRLLGLVSLPNSGSPRRTGVMGGLLFAVFAVASAVVEQSRGGTLTKDPTGLLLSLLLALALAPMLTVSVTSGARRATLIDAAAVVVLYFGWHWGFAQMGGAEPVSGSLWARSVLVALGFLGLFVLQSNFVSHPGGVLRQKLHHHLFAGFNLDERFTRLTFRIWPPRLSTPSLRKEPSLTGETLEA